MWINNFTGEVYENLWHAVTTIISDMVKNRACRTVKMLSISPFR